MIEIVENEFTVGLEFPLICGDHMEGNHIDYWGREEYQGVAMMIFTIPKDIKDIYY